MILENTFQIWKIEPKQNPFLVSRIQSSSYAPGYENKIEKLKKIQIQPGQFSIDSIRFWPHVLKCVVHPYILTHLFLTFSHEIHVKSIFERYMCICMSDVHSGLLGAN